ncbi:MAG: hypothetical protein ACI9UA_001650, partial [Pseudoalteromonas tetraodonis]
STLCGGDDRPTGWRESAALELGLASAGLLCDGWNLPQSYEFESQR